jgi:hypothetical protein
MNYTINMHKLKDAKTKPSGYEGGTGFEKVGRELGKYGMKRGRGCVNGKSD